MHCQKGIKVKTGANYKDIIQGLYCVIMIIRKVEGQT